MRAAIVRASACAAIALLLAGCVSGVGSPLPIADSEPGSGGCPPKICPQPTHSGGGGPGPSSEPEPTITGGGPSQPSKKPSTGRTPTTSRPGSQIPGPTSTATAPGVKPASQNRFAPFPFDEFAFAQAFPLVPPPPPAPLSQPIPIAFVALAASLAAGAGALTFLTARRTPAGKGGS